MVYLLRTCSLLVLALLFNHVCSAQQVLHELRLPALVDTNLSITRMAAKGENTLWAIRDEEGDGSMVVYNKAANRLWHYSQQVGPKPANFLGSAYGLYADVFADKHKKVFGLNYAFCGDAVLSNFYHFGKAFYFFECSSDGSVAAVTDTIVFDKKERLIFSVANDSTFYILTGYKGDANRLSLYVKNGRQRHSRFEYNTNDFAVEQERKAFRDAQLALEPYRKEEIIPRLYHYDSSSRFYYTSLQPWDKVFFRQGQLHLLQQNVENQLLLLSFTLPDMQLSARAYSLRQKQLQKDSLFTARGQDLGVRKVLGMEANNIQSTVHGHYTIGVVDNQGTLGTFFFDNRTGRLADFWLLNKNDTTWPNGRFVPSDSAGYPATDLNVKGYLQRLKSSIPSVSVQSINDSIWRVSLGVADERKAEKVKDLGLILGGIASAFMSPGAALGMLGTMAGSRAPIDNESVINYYQFINAGTLQRTLALNMLTPLEQVERQKLSSLKHYVNGEKEKGKRLRLAVDYDDKGVTLLLLDFDANSLKLLRF